MSAVLEDTAFLEYRQAKSFVGVRVAARGVRDEAGNWHGMSPWNPDHHCRASQEKEVDEAFIARLRGLLARARNIIELHRRGV